MKKFTTAAHEIEADESGEEEYVEFELDGRVMRAYYPHEGQMTFMIAGLGRGQTDDSRFGVIVNIMMESMRGADKDYLESRLVTGDKKKKIPMKQLEEIFEYLTEQWFGDPTQQSSDSVPSQ